MKDIPTNGPATADTLPPCPCCGQPMRLARSVPAVGGMPELRTFECRPCGISQTAAVEHRSDGGQQYSFD